VTVSRTVVIVEARIGEITEHRFVGGMLHGELVLRGTPQICFARWQAAQVSLPTNAAAAVASAEKPTGGPLCKPGVNNSKDRQP
jgi:hypothetical protein